MILGVIVIPGTRLPGSGMVCEGINLLRLLFGVKLLTVPMPRPT